MIQEQTSRNPPFVPFRFKRYFEAQNRRIRVFGQCEITAKTFELFIPTEEFFTYTQGFKSIDDALKSLTSQEREFISKGVSPEGNASRFPAI